MCTSVLCRYGFSQSLASVGPYQVQSKELKADLEQGLWFDANIPQGYGVGSSAALVAALLHHYGIQIPDGLAEKRILFGEIESYFHGKSSGLDVLVSFENTPLLIDGAGSIRAIALPDNQGMQVRLVDSMETGITSQLVNQFNGKSEEFKSIFKKEYVATTQAAIRAFLDQTIDELMHHCRKLSRFAFDHMDFAIPENQKAVWKNGLQAENYCLKLCGSGGGGFALSFSRDAPPFDSIRVF